MPTVPIGDLELYYEVHGEGQPLLLIAGFGADIMEWGTIIPTRLAENRQVILFDNRGCGRTTQPPGPYAMPQMARDAVGLLDYLHIPKADVIGCSMGGMIAQYVALDYPMRVRRLILGCTMAGRGNFRLPRLRALLNMNQKSSGDPFSDYWKRSLANNFTRDFIIGNRELLENHTRARLQHPASKEAKESQIRAIIYTHNAYPRLGTLTMPTLVMAGTRDGFIPPENSTIIAEKIPGAQLRFLPGAGHVFWISHPEETLAAWSAFLADRPVPEVAPSDVPTAPEVTTGTADGLAVAAGGRLSPGD